MALRGAIEKMVIVGAAMAFASPALATTFDEIQVTKVEPGVNNLTPVVSGNKIAYERNDGTSQQIYLYDIQSGADPIPLTTGNDILEDMDGSYVVFARGPLGNHDIWAYDLTDSTEFVVTGAADDQTSPAINGARTVWQDHQSGSYEIETDTLSGDTASAANAIFPEAGDEVHPRVSGNWVVFELDRPSGDSDVYAWNVTNPGVLVPVAVDAASQAISPDVDGSRVVWQDNRAGNWDIFSADLNDVAGTTVQITSDVATQQNPRVSGDVVVWEDFRHFATTGIDLYAYDFASPTSDGTVVEQSAGNQHLEDIDGTTVVFSDTRDLSGQEEIYALVEVATDPTGSGDPCDPASGAPVLYSATYTRGHGQPQKVSASFASGFSSGTVCLSLTHVSSAEVDLNGASVFGPSDFNPNLTAAEASVNLGLSNTLDVTVRGKPCGGNDGGDGDHGGCGGNGGDGDHHHHHFDGHHHHEGDGDDGDDDGGSSNGSTCSSIALRVVGPIPAAAPTTLPNTFTTFTCDVHGASTGFDFRALLPLLLAAGLIVGRRRRA